MIPDTTLQPANLPCPNCQEPYQPQAHYCSRCGQDLHSHNVPFRHFLLEFLEGTIHFDHKVMGTLKTLLINPGLITRNYNQNKRARYVPPVRLYVFISFIYFFLIAGGVNNSIEIITDKLKQHTLRADQPITMEALTKTVVDPPVVKELSAIPHLDAAETGRILKAHHIATDNINNKLITKNILLYRGELSPEVIGHQLLSFISKGVFVLMPVFAFLIWLICGRRKMFYSEALIFSLYFHCFYFILLTLGWLAGRVFHLPSIDLYLFLIACIYLFISIRTAFNKNIWKALLQSVLLIFSYTIVFTGVLILAIVSSIIL